MKTTKRKTGYTNKIRRGLQKRIDAAKEDRKEQKAMHTRAKAAGKAKALKARERELEKEYERKALRRMRPAEHSPMSMMSPAAPRTPSKKGTKKNPANELKDLYDNLL